MLASSRPQSSRMTSLTRTNMDAGVISAGTVQRTDKSFVQDIIHTISNSKKNVYKLALRHSDLAGKGCVELFHYLRLHPERASTIIEIDLRMTGTDDDGLTAISMFLANNSTLRSLFLQSNAFGADEHVFDNFVRAINTSRLEVLNLSSNSHGPIFVPRLLDMLETRYLRVLELSMLELDPSSLSHITAYICSPRCRLRSLTLNGNMLTFDGIKTIIKALRGNYTLLSLDLHANDTLTQENSHKYYRLLDTDQAEVQVRNGILRRIVFKEALQLLCHARPIVLQPRTPSAPTMTPSTPSLPTEIVLHVLFCLCPRLSPAQHLRIIEYASDPATLPALLPPIRPITQHVRRDSESLTDREDLDEWARSMDCDAFEPYCGSTQESEVPK